MEGRKEEEQILEWPTGLRGMPSPEIKKQTKTRASKTGKIGVEFNLDYLLNSVSTEFEVPMEYLIRAIQ